MHGSFVLSALFDLAATDELTLEIVWEPRPELYALVADVVLANSGAVRRVCWDIQDRSYWWSESALAESDVYFKRSYFAPDVAKLESTQRSRVRPFGPVFIHGSPKSRGPLVAAWLKHGWTRGHRASETLRRLFDYLRLPPIRTFEASSSNEPRPQILFQTRLWEQREVTGEPSADEINAERVNIVRALKDTLGNRFAGGLVPTPLARSRHPDLLCPEDTKRAHYLSTMRSSQIGIYTRGLHHSTAWKLGEYLAAGCAIVASGLRNALPHALESGQHLLPFSDPQAAAETALQLLDDPERREAMRAANAAYYRQHAQPSVQIRRCIHAAFDQSVRPKGEKATDGTL